MFCVSIRLLRLAPNSLCLASPRLRNLAVADLAMASRTGVLSFAWRRIRRTLALSERRSETKTTLADRIAFACVVAVALMTAGGWVYALVAERHAERVMQTRYSQPTPELRAALAAGEPDDADDVHLAHGR